MTKEELDKEAEEWLSITDNHLNDERTHFLSESEYAEQAYLAGAEPREKRIAELKAQIEKMKCCGNCKNFNNFQEHCELDATHSVECHCNNYKLWEIKEK